MSWESRFEITTKFRALQHAMNLKFQDDCLCVGIPERSLPEETGGDALLSMTKSAAKSTVLRRSARPAQMRPQHVHRRAKALLYYVMVIAWAEDFTGAVIDYGAFPDQHRRRFFACGRIRPSSPVFPDAGLEGQPVRRAEHMTEDYRTRIPSRERRDAYRTRHGGCQLGAIDGYRV